MGVLTGPEVSVCNRVMATTALAKRATELETTNARLRGRLARLREGADEQAARLQTAVTASAASYLWNRYKAREVAAGRPVPLSNALGSSVAPELMLGLAAYMLGPMAGGTTGKVIEDAGLGLVCGYAADQGRTAR